MEGQTEIKVLFGEMYCSAEYLKKFFELKDIDGVYYRMKKWGINGKMFGNGVKYWSLSRVQQELKK